MKTRPMRWMLTVAIVLLVGLCAHLLQAQDAAGPAPGAPPDQFGPGGPENPGFRPPDPARMQEMMLERIKENLNVSEEEWPVIKPLVTQVMKLQQASRMRGGPGMAPGGPGGPGAPAGPGAPSAPAGMTRTSSPEETALMAVIDKSGASAEELNARLTALRQARAKQAGELKAAREKLRGVLTLRQEALLVLAGLLE